MAKVLDLDATDNKVCKQYRKDIFKKISHLPFSEKRNVLQKADEEFLNILENIKILDIPKIWLYVFIQHDY